MSSHSLHGYCLYTHPHTHPHPHPHPPPPPHIQILFINASTFVRRTEPVYKTIKLAVIKFCDTIFLPECNFSLQHQRQKTYLRTFAPSEAGKSACASAQSDLKLRWAHEDTLVHPWLSKTRPLIRLCECAG